MFTWYGTRGINKTIKAFGQQTFEDLKQDWGDGWSVFIRINRGRKAFRNRSNIGNSPANGKGPTIEQYSKNESKFRGQNMDDFLKKRGKNLWGSQPPKESRAFKRVTNSEERKVYLLNLTS